MKITSSLFGLFVLLLLSATSYAQTVCPHCGRIHQSPQVGSALTLPPSTGTVAPVTLPLSTEVVTPVTFPVSTGAATPVAAPFSPAASYADDAQALAQQKANLAASTMNKGHVGGSLGPATHEGVGFSTESAQQAIDAACYSGSSISAQGPGRPRIGTATARGSDGWYACLLCL